MLGISAEVDEAEKPIHMSWMWADAKIAPGMHFAAHLNPMRWFSGTPREVRDSLARYVKKIARPVKLKIKMEDTQKKATLSSSCTFAHQSEAIKWLDAGFLDRTDSLAGNYVIPSKTFLSLAMAVLSIPALALYLRILTAGEQGEQGGRNWSRRNYFVAYAYASRVVSFPKKVKKAQLENVERFKSQNLSWESFREEDDRLLCPFIRLAQMLPNERPFEVEHQNEKWTLLENASTDLFVVYTNGSEAIMAVRGGDSSSRLDDLTTHPGSPVRAFVQAEDEERVPVEVLPFSTLEKELLEYSLTLVCYSQGAIVGLAMAHRFSSWPFRRIVLFNGAMLFWPQWLGSGKEEPAFKCISYVVEGDPLSDPGQGAPQAPGTTFLMPTRGSGFDNHYLWYFDEHSGETLTVTN